MQDKIRKFSSS